MKKITFIILLLFSFASFAGTKKDVTALGVSGSNGLPQSHNIQVVLNALSVNDTAYFPAGTYIIDTPVFGINPNIHYLGAGVSTIWKVKDGIADWYHLSQKMIGMLNIGASNCTVDSLYFDQNFRGNGVDGDTAKIRGIIMGVTSLVAGSVVDTYNTTILRCHFYDYYGDCINSTGLANNYNSLIHDNTFVSAFIAEAWSTAGTNGQQAIGFNNAYNVYIYNNHISGALDDAIGLHFCNQVRIINNDVTTTGGRLYLASSFTSLIDGNSITYLTDGNSCIFISIEKSVPNRLTWISHNTVNTVNIDISVDSTRYYARFLGPGNLVYLLNNTFLGKLVKYAAFETRTRTKDGDPNYYGDSTYIKYNQIKNAPYLVKKTGTFSAFIDSANNKIIP